MSTWWQSKPAIGVGGVLVGLLIGVSGSGEAEGEADDLKQQVSTLRSSNSDLKEDVAQLTEAAGSGVEEQIEAALEDAKVEADAAQDEAVAAAVAQEKQKADERVARAKVAVKKKAPAKPAQPKPAAPSTDPRFDTCGEANDAGYGPYQQGSDPEYDWYQDRDGDGLVCES